MHHITLFGFEKYSETLLSRPIKAPNSPLAIYKYETDFLPSILSWKASIPAYCH